MTFKVHESLRYARSPVPGFLSFNAIYMVVISVCLLMLAGLYLSPKWVCLYLILPYYTLTLTLGKHEVKDGDRWLAFSKQFFIFRTNRKYLNLKLLHSVPKILLEAEKAPNAQFLIAVFPHGTASDYRILMDGLLDQVFPNVHGKIRTLAATVLFRIPIIRELALWTGCIDARRYVAEKALDNGRTLVVVPGGEAEQIRTTRGKEIVYLKHRKGFIKLAMRKGVPVIPTYAFGASDYFYTSHAFFGPREWLRKRFGVCIPLSVGLWGSFFCPLPVDTTIIFGKPLSFEMKLKGAPTTEELDVAHAKFCSSLTELFDEHKEALGYGDRKLDIV
jgi:hypothetical protein